MTANGYHFGGGRVIKISKILIVAQLCDYTKDN